MGFNYNDVRGRGHLIKKVTNDLPIRINCGNCGQEAFTTVEHTNGAGAWCCCVLLVAMGFTLCSCIPFCATPCQDADHFCNHCGKIVATKRVMC